MEKITIEQAAEMIVNLGYESNEQSIILFFEGYNAAVNVLTQINANYKHNYNTVAIGYHKC